jgi:hypothetical protein
MGAQQLGAGIRYVVVGAKQLVIGAGTIVRGTIGL